MVALLLLLNVWMTWVAENSFIFGKGIDVGSEVGQDNARPFGLQVVQYIYTVAFTVEIVMRLLADREEQKCRSDDCLWRLSSLIPAHLICFLICGQFDLGKGVSDIMAWIFGIARKRFIRCPTRLAV